MRQTRRERRLSDTSIKKKAARLREVDAFFDPLEESHAQLFLQCEDLSAKSRLGKMEALRCPR